VVATELLGYIGDEVKKKDDGIDTWEALYLLKMESG